MEPLSWTLLLSFIRKYWKVFLYPLLVLGVYYYGHHQGYSEANLKIAEKTIKIIEHNQEETTKENTKNTQIETKIRKARALNPNNDKRDSCLLSKDPFITDCLKQ